MWHLHRDALTWPQHVFSEWDDISSQTVLLPIAQPTPANSNITWFWEKEGHLRENLRLFRRNVKIIVKGGQTRHSVFTSFVIILSSQRPQIVFSLRNRSHLTKILFLDHPNWMLFNECWNQLQNCATKRCRVWLSVQCVLTQPPHACPAKALQPLQSAASSLRSPLWYSWFILKEEIGWNTPIPYLVSGFAHVMWGTHCWKGSRMEAPISN